jgi:4-hydroxybenzoate polyprenyltransferase
MVKIDSFIFNKIGIIESKPLKIYLISFVFIITLRNCFELFSSSGTFSFLACYHFTLFYVLLAIWLSIFFKISTNKSLINSIKIILASFIVILIPPIIDLILTRGDGILIGYSFPNNFKEFVFNYFIFWGKTFGGSVTVGIRLEIILVIVGFFIFIFQISRRIFYSLFKSILLYTLFYIFSNIPFIYKHFLIFFGFKISNFNEDLINFYLLLILPSMVILSYMYDKKVLIELLKDMRVTRVIHFFLLFGIGFVLASKILFSQFIINSNLIFYSVFIFYSFLAAIFFSIITNNISDFEIDIISNKNRPLVTNSISIKKYKLLALIFLFISIIYSIQIHWKIFFLVMVFISIYYLYSMDPYRIKRVLIFSKVLIAFNSLITLIIGYEFYSIFSICFSEPENANTFLIRLPNYLYFIFLIGYSISLNFIDIKDYEGDKLAGIRTLPTVLGLQKSKHVIALLNLISYIFIWFLVSNIYVATLIVILGISQSFALIRKKYNELFVFIPYLINLLIILIYLLFYTNKII